MNRREFLQILAAASAAGILPHSSASAKGLPTNFYDFAPFGDVRFLHTADTHAQLLPIYFREPNVNLGIGDARGKPPHLVGERLLSYYGIPVGGALAHAFSHVGFDELARRFGRVGGFSHLATLSKKLRGEYGRHRTLHLDSGDMWQGSATALYNRGRDMVRAANLLGVEAMTGHWEFTYPEAEIRANIAAFDGDFVAQNIVVKEESQFDGAPVFDEETGQAFPPFVMKNLDGRRIAIIGQAFPYTPIANPQRFIPDWEFGMRADSLAVLVRQLREREKPDLVVLLSHNGADADVALAGRVGGIDVILGGHTHDALFNPLIASSPNGATLIAHGGASGKFLGCLDVKIADGGGMGDFRYRLLPVFSEYLAPDAEMESLIKEIRAPYEKELSEELTFAGETLFRRGSFNGTLDQVIADALRARLDSQIALSPGFRWGATILSGDMVRMEDVMNATAMNYPETYVREMSGAEIKLIMEDVADNMFNPDPFYRQGGDMVRVSGMRYGIDRQEAIGRRIYDLRLNTGEPLAADKRYKVAGWATASLSSGRPVWDEVADYLRATDAIASSDFELNLPRLRNARNDPSIADYPEELLE